VSLKVFDALLVNDTEVVQVPVVLVIVHAKANDEDIGDHEADIIREVVMLQVLRVPLVEKGRELEGGRLHALEDTVSLNDGRARIE
jgi:hypothetical protein